MPADVVDYLIGTVAGVSLFIGVIASWRTARKEHSFYPDTRRWRPTDSLILAGAFTLALFVLVAYFVMRLALGSGT